ncbi:single-stranded DNA-binding protein [Sphingobacterium sp. DR205]|uniref:single-stranded DNA-binding protein n=1 Tax=Sphingobacterium sp. DR205 TaxID=2713573 RepID=UPI0013E443DD|nr:single-stranded DNA-binding protein [Sphingobacterium sp. DR205]QIH34535.1 single-stranded DNA-binding protein [Sphingobacterium sp. DR205]
MNITGRITRNAEVSTTDSGKAVVNFSVAINDVYKNKQGEKIENTAFFGCSYWKNTAIANYLTQGQLVELSGRVSVRAWLGKDGEPKAGLNFYTSEIKLLGGGAKGQNDSKKVATAENTDKEDDLPF